METEESTEAAAAPPQQDEPHHTTEEPEEPEEPEGLEALLRRYLAKEGEPWPEKDEAVEGIKDTIAQILRALDLPYEVQVFGSFVNGFKSSASDVDVVLLSRTTPPTPCSKTQVLTKIANYLESNDGPAHGFTNLTRILQARVPLLKITHEQSGLEVDLCVENRLGVHNSRLLATYSQVDPRVSDLGRLVKAWAKDRQIVGSADGTLNSYAYMLLAIFYLQTISPPILPNLQQWDAAEGYWSGRGGPSRAHKAAHAADDSKCADGGGGGARDGDSDSFERQMEGEHDVWFFANVERVRATQAATNTLSTHTLFLGFCHFYCHVFNWSEHAVSIRLALPQRFERRTTDTSLSNTSQSEDNDDSSDEQQNPNTNTRGGLLFGSSSSSGGGGHNNSNSNGGSGGAVGGGGSGGRVQHMQGVDKFGLAVSCTREQWYVEDPFDVSHNLAAKCSKRGKERILAECRDCMQEWVFEAMLRRLLVQVANPDTEEVCYLKMRVNATTSPEDVFRTFEGCQLSCIYFPNFPSHLTRNTDANTTNTGTADDANTDNTPAHKRGGGTGIVPCNVLRAYGYCYLELPSKAARRKALCKNESYILESNGGGGSTAQVILHYSCAQALNDAQSSSIWCFSRLTKDDLTQAAAQPQPLHDHNSIGTSSSPLSNSSLPPSAFNCLLKPDGSSSPAADMRSEAMQDALLKLVQSGGVPVHTHTTEGGGREERGNDGGGAARQRPAGDQIETRLLDFLRDSPASPVEEKLPPLPRRAYREDHRGHIDVGVAMGSGSWGGGAPEVALHLPSHPSFPSMPAHHNQHHHQHQLHLQQQLQQQQQQQPQHNNWSDGPAVSGLLATLNDFTPVNAGGAQMQPAVFRPTSSGMGMGGVGRGGGMHYGGGHGGVRGVGAYQEPTAPPYAPPPWSHGYSRGVGVGGLKESGQRIPNNSTALMMKIRSLMGTAATQTSPPNGTVPHAASCDQLPQRQSKKRTNDSDESTASASSTSTASQSPLVPTTEATPPREDPHTQACEFLKSLSENTPDPRKEPIRFGAKQRGGGGGGGLHLVNAKP
ncbi:unnamed protein product [Vitrella brassicaformis CCMP3155]|uniref:Poly(A) RNA polymerase mitochondrial-like central palm domain-containing protein n=1 Tax=Vitrella brassicaformis (strain CCMP3155) TaxID=1169540 RepID=A0A0G4H6I3_VITBC|nr:unnamed protein product [Vitrella brassicaformis CCMP3155]|eukprot:CEM39480.1 unnamed protein product [Vitrella brassicaformis CCMP3155]